MDEKYGNKHLLTALRDPNPFVRERVLQVLNERQARADNPPPESLSEAVPSR